MNKLEEALAYIETLQSKNDETDVSSALKSLLPEGEQATGDLLKELIAFSFGEHNEKDELGWNTYFSPGMIWYDGEKTLVTPDISQVDADAIDYWKKRANETSNPLLKARYAGLVWDMEKKITNQKPSINYAIANIESLIILSDANRYKYDVSVKDKLERALSLASSINKPELIESTRKAILAYEDKIAIDDKPGLWGFSYDYLVDNKKSLLTEEEEANIISSLESRLERLTECENSDTHAAEVAATRLAAYYQKRSKPDDARRVMLQLGKAYEADKDPSVLNRSGRLEHLHKLYVHYKLHEDAKALLIKLRAISAGAKDELKTFSQEMTFPREEVEQLIDSLLKYDEKTSTANVVSYFSPDKDENEKQLMALAKKHPLSFMMGVNIIDERGRSVAQIGSIMNDLEGRIIQQISQHLDFTAMFLHLALAAYIDKFRIDASKFINDHLKLSPAFMYGRWEILERSLTAYLAGDYMLFIHFVIPQIEDAFRTLVEVSGGQIMKLHRGGALHLKTFDDVLRDESLLRIFGEDFILYSRILLTEQRGWNLRNDLCHGLMSEGKMAVMAADRLFHILMTLSLLTTQSSETSPVQSDTPNPPE
jgi:hypothetical protein